MISGSGVDTTSIRPYVEILEQPASKALRFRYECEGRSAGSIPGENHSPDNKTFPTIRINGYQGRGVVLVSCVTKDHPYRPHPHSLVGKGTCHRGICRMEFTSDNPVVTFSNLGIQCVKKKDIYTALQNREDLAVDPFRTGFDHKSQATGIDLNVVRLCFQVFVEAPNGKINVELQPVVSHVIFDKKAMSDLQICKLSHSSASVDGGKEVVLLCEKVAKDNIQVRFFEMRDGREVWEGFGDFKSIYVHKQVAILFRTPCYKDRRVVEPVQVYVQLRRPTDGVTSEPCPFEFSPSNAGEPDFLKRKRRRLGNIPAMLLQLQAQSEKQAALLDNPLERNVNPMKLEARVQSFPIDSSPFCTAAWDQSPTTNQRKNHIDAPIAAGQSPLFNPAWGRLPAPNQSNILVDVPAYGSQISPGKVPLSRAYESYDMPLMPNRTSVSDQYQTSAKNPRSCKMQQQEGTSKIHQTTSPPFNYYHQQPIELQPELILQKITPPSTAFDRNENPELFQGAVGGAGLMEMSSHQPCSSGANLSQIDSADLARFDDVLSDSFYSGLLMNDVCAKVETNETSVTLPMSVGSTVS